MHSNQRSQQLFSEAKTLIPGGVNSPVRAFRGVGGEPFFVDRAYGGRIWDVDGNEYVDFVGTWGPAILGHAPAVVREAISTAAERGVSFGIPNPLEIEMARIILRWVPSIQKVRMVNSGTEATMSCIRLARGYTGRKKLLKFEGCYHGHVDSLLVKAGSGALTHGQPDSAGVSIRPSAGRDWCRYGAGGPRRVSFAAESASAAGFRPVDGKCAVFLASSFIHTDV